MTDTTPTPRPPRKPVKVVWKFLTFFGFVIPAMVAASLATSFGVGAIVSGQLTSAIGPWIIAAAVLLCTWACLALFEHKPLGAIGLGFDRRWLLHTAAGLALGAALVTIVWGIFVVLGLAEFLRGPANPNLASGILLTALMFGGVALLEELISRGYPFQVIAQRNKPVALIICGLFFVALHLPNDGGIDPVAIANLFIVHILFAVLYLRARSLWLPVGVHASWNFSLGSIFGMSVSGNDAPATLLVTTTKQGLWTGHAFGPEGGLIVTIILVVATVCACKFMKQQYPSPDLLSQEDPAATTARQESDETMAAPT